MQWLKLLDAGLSPRMPEFDTRPIHVGFVMNTVALGWVILQVLQLSPVLHNHLRITDVT